jgi:sortase (surface protein transpeptidase)
MPCGAQVRYRVHTTRIINKNNTIVMNQKDDSRITFITCYPFQAFLPGDQRFVVIAIQEQEKRDHDIKQKSTPLRRLRPQPNNGRTILKEPVTGI